MQNPSLALFIALHIVGAPADATPERFDLTTLLRHAAQQASVTAARASTARAEARAEEVAHLWIPRFELSVLGGPTPEVKCFPSAAECTSTTPTLLEPALSGVFYRADLRIEMPLYTFGKLTAGKEASAAGARANAALAEQSAHDAVVDAARAYFAVKLGRELELMLDEGRERVQGEVHRQEGLLAHDSGEVSEADHRRLLTLLSEIAARTSEARRITEAGLAGVRYALGRDRADADVDELPLAPMVYTLPTRQTARAMATARPERRAAQAGLEAAEHLTTLERAGYWPDIVLVGIGAVADATAVEHPHNAFLNDPFNTLSGGAGIYVRWVPDIATRLSKVAQAEAEMARAAALVGMAEDGLPADAERVLGEARDARDRLQAATTGEAHTHAWLASLMQAEAAGLVETRDLADALLQNFMMRGRAMQATFDWNVSVMALQRAIGAVPTAHPFRMEE